MDPLDNGIFSTQAVRGARGEVSERYQEAEMTQDGKNKRFHLSVFSVSH